MKYDKLVQKMRAMHKAGATIYLMFKGDEWLMASTQTDGHGVVSLQDAIRAVGNLRGADFEVKEDHYEDSGYAFAPTLEVTIPLHRENCMVTQDEVDAAYEDEQPTPPTDQRIPDWSMRENPIHNLELKNRYL